CFDKSLVGGPWNYRPEGPERFGPDVKKSVRNVTRKVNQGAGRRPKRSVADLNIKFVSIEDLDHLILDSMDVEWHTDSGRRDNLVHIRLTPRLAAGEFKGELMPGQNQLPSLG